MRLRGFGTWVAVMSIATAVGADATKERVETEVDALDAVTWADVKARVACVGGDCNDEAGHDAEPWRPGEAEPWRPGNAIDRPPPAAAVPEPSGFLVFAMAALLLGGTLRRQVFAHGEALAVAVPADAPPTPNATARSLKRALDVIGASTGLLLSLPVLALAMLAIRLETPGSPLFGQTRCGRDGRCFTMWKLRTMVADAERQRAALEERNQMSGPVFKLADDPRVTRLGRLLRRYSLDELPQFWNVLRGDMSLVGPRPPLPSEVAVYGQRERRRLEVEPGLTCIWQVSGRNRIDFDDWIGMDLDYIDHWSLGRDLVLLARTVPAVVRGDGAC